MDIVKKCPLCGSNDVKQGMHILQGMMFRLDANVNKKLINQGSNIIADICTSCGSILSMKVEKPEIFK